MRYTLDSTLPINAFSPRGGRSPFNRGMTLEGGGGGGVGGAINSVVKPVVKGVSDVVKFAYEPVKQTPFIGKEIDKALVGLDKSVNKAIPGGWGTLGTIAASFIPGVGPMAMMGLGALTGSGVLRPNGNFNLQGAIMGGAMAYGASQLSAGLQEAGKAGMEAGSSASSDAIAEAAKEGTTSAVAQTPQTDVNAGLAGTNNPTVADTMSTPYSNKLVTAAGEVNGTAIPSRPLSVYEAAQSNIDPGLLESGIPKEVVAEAPVLNTPTTSSGLSNLAKGTVANLSEAGTGIKNLTGFGTPSVSDAFTAFKDQITPGGVTAGLVGTAGLADLEAQRDYLDQQAKAGAIGQAEYQTALNKINAEIETARSTVAAHPLQTSADMSNISSAPTSYDKTSGLGTLYAKSPTNLYAMGGEINSPDDQTNIPNQSPLHNLEAGGIAGFAMGGMAGGRFLNGGGDGMSDSIHANIDGHQEARLADGEFVIPADVVSHLGNGSSKAGAKQLYTMMDRVRQARTGRKSQGKQINPRKYMAA